MKRILSLFVLLFFVLSANAADKKRILLINSYHTNLSWTDSLYYGFNNALKVGEIKAEIYIENLDFKRIRNTNYIDKFTEFIVAKYVPQGVDLIVVTDNDAFNYVKQLKENSFIDVPVVFCGVNNIYSFPENFAGIIEEVDVTKNIDLIASLHPQLKTLYCVVDQTTTGVIFEKTINEIVSRRKYSFNINVLTNLTIHELIAKIGQIDGNSVILFLLYNQDKDGVYLTYEDVLDSVSIHSKVPIYGTWGFYLEHGIVGGNIISGREHGRQAGEMVVRFFNGVSISKLGTKLGNSKYVFDYTYMKKHNIGLSQVPRGAVVLNNPFLYLKKNKAEIIFILTIFVILVVIIYLLLVINKSRNKLIEIHKSFNQELKEKNQQIAESLREAEEANSLKSAFLANMSHEIRTPMNAIMGFSKLILLRKEQPKQEFENFLNIIIDNSQKLLNLINDIIDISKIEVNQLNFNLREFNLVDVLRNCYNNAEVERIRLEKNELDLNFTFTSGDSQLFLISDPDRIQQVVMNLLNNALKFTEKGSITLKYEHKGDWVDVHVQDTGVGIDTDNIDVIFDRFRQVENVLTRKYGGSGLGLSICKGIITGLGGEIGVNSEVGKGSTFWFRIPYNQPQSRGKVNSGNSELRISQLQNKTILIVEDNFISTRLLEETLKHTKAKLILTGNAEEAIEICKGNTSINLILMDIQLPGMDGYEATRIIKQIRPNLPIIAQTANAMSNEKEKAIQMGCDDYVSKPYDLDYLMRSIERLVN